LEARANVNAASNDGVTPLYMASQEGHADAVKLLLAAGANVNAVDYSRNTRWYRHPEAAMPRRSNSY